MGLCTWMCDCIFSKILSIFVFVFWTDLIQVPILVKIWMGNSMQIKLFVFLYFARLRMSFNCQCNFFILFIIGFKHFMQRFCLSFYDLFGFHFLNLWLKVTPINYAGLQITFALSDWGSFFNCRCIFLAQNFMFIASPIFMAFWKDATKSFCL